MKKTKQIMAIAGVLLLVGLYVTTLVLALTSNPNSMNLFKASIFSTIVIPVLIWIYTFIYKLIKKNK